MASATAELHEATHSCEATCPDLAGKLLHLERAAALVICLVSGTVTAAVVGTCTELDMKLVLTR